MTVKITKFFITSLAIGMILNVNAATAEPSVCTLDRATGTTIDKEPFLPKADGLQYNAVMNEIAYMRANEKGYYRIYTVSANGGKQQELAAQLPAGRHQGTPMWHPSGRYIMFTAEKPAWKDTKLFGVPDYGALPGWGMHDDIWLASSDGKQFWQLTHDEMTKDQGDLIPVFSPDGRHIAWSSKLAGKGLVYEIKVADFVETPQPHLEHIRIYQPGGATYYEPGGFTSDSAHLAYTSDQDTHSFWQSQIYLLDLDSGKSTRLTQGKDYNEHPRLIGTPTGDWIVYMSTRDAKRRPFHLTLGTDWYAVKSDGSGLKRLTTMNAEKGNPEDAGFVQVATAVAQGPAPDILFGDVQDDLVKQTGLVRVIRLVCGPSSSGR